MLRNPASVQSAYVSLLCSCVESTLCRRTTCVRQEVPGIQQLHATRLDWQPSCLVERRVSGICSTTDALAFQHSSHINTRNNGAAVQRVQSLQCVPLPSTPPCKSRVVGEEAVACTFQLTKQQASERAGKQASERESEQASRRCYYITV